jgi:hypothetical protein
MNNEPQPTHLARIRPTLPHGVRHVYGRAFHRLKGWYPVTPEEAAYLARQPANEGDPFGPKLFDAVTLEEAKQLDVLEQRPARLGGSASNPVGRDGFVPPEKADTHTRDLQARLDAAEERALLAEAAQRQQSAQLAAIMSKLNMDPIGASVFSDPIPKDQNKAKDAVPQRPDRGERPGAVPRNKPATGPQNTQPGDDKTIPESSPSES